MKKGGVLALSLFFFCQGSSFGQVDQVRIQKKWSEMDFAPCIAGYHDGEIPIDRICDARGLYTKRGLNIVSFSIEIETVEYDTLLTVAGHNIPDTICALIQREGAKKHYYFTRIRAVDLDGSIKHLSPMHLVTIRKEEE
jgi:hypothetical protein